MLNMLYTCLYMHPLWIFFTNQVLYGYRYAESATVLCAIVLTEDKAWYVFIKIWYIFLHDSYKS